MCNLPVVATPAGDIEELLDGVEPSWLCDSEPEALGRALAACVESPRRSNGREAAHALSDEAIAARLLSLYRSLAPIEVAPAREDA